MLATDRGRKKDVFVDNEFCMHVLHLWDLT